MKKYRRIEINAYHRRVTVVSGEWRQSDLFGASSAEASHDVSINDTDLCEPIPPESPEGQSLLLEAMRSLEGRLSPENREMIHTGTHPVLANNSNRNRFFLWLRSLNFLDRTACRFMNPETNQASTAFELAGSMNSRGLCYETKNEMRVSNNINGDKSCLL